MEEEEGTRARSFRMEDYNNRRVFLRSYPLRWEDKDDDGDGGGREEGDGGGKTKLASLKKHRVVVVVIFRWGGAKVRLLRKLKNKAGFYLFACQTFGINPPTTSSSLLRTLGFFRHPPPLQLRRSKQDAEERNAQPLLPSLPSPPPGGPSGVLLRTPHLLGHHDGGQHLHRRGHHHQVSGDPRPPPSPTSPPSSMRAPRPASSSAPSPTSSAPRTSSWLTPPSLAPASSSVPRPSCRPPCAASRRSSIYQILSANRDRLDPESVSTSTRSSLSLNSCSSIISDLDD